MRTILAVLMAALAAVPASGRGEGRFDDEDRRGGRGLRRASPAAPALPRSPGAAPWEPRTVPRAFGAERREGAVAPAAAAPGRPRAGSATVVPGGTFAVQQRVEVVPGRYYWHASAGSRYCHFYDGRWHWYGFYAGPAFYWTRWYDDRWWWWDVRFGRWVYWWDGYWWWWGPGGDVYIYVDDVYYPYDGSPAPGGAAPPQPPSSGATFVSPDARREVVIAGPDARAFLYDRTPGGPVYRKALAAGVAMVSFRGGRDGAPLGILLAYKDKTKGVSLFDADGEPLAGGGSSAPEPPADVPAELPPAPTSAPGR